MTDSLLTNMTLELYRKLKSVEPEEKVIEAINEMVESNGLAETENVPFWFLDLWQSILNETSTEKIFFLMSEIVGGKGDVVNFLAELADVIEMNYDNYGEGIEMVFDSLRIRAFISMEGGGGTGFYQIQFVNDIT
jgi:hypothetical protein